jgi:hypothetical protein
MAASSGSAYSSVIHHQQSHIWLAGLLQVALVACAAIGVESWAETGFPYYQYVPCLKEVITLEREVDAIIAGYLATRYESVTRSWSCRPAGDWRDNVPANLAHTLWASMASCAADDTWLLFAMAFWHTALRQVRTAACHTDPCMPLAASLQHAGSGTSQHALRYQCCCMLLCDAALQAAVMQHCRQL